MNMGKEPRVDIPTTVPGGEMWKKTVSLGLFEKQG